jgi:hypothetical protein
MAAPYLSERVRVRGSDMQYFVVKVDEEHQEVDLIAVASDRTLQAVPFSDLSDSTRPTRPS